MSVDDYDFLFRINEVGVNLTGCRSLLIRYNQNYFKDNNPNILEKLKDLIIKEIEIENKLIKCIIYGPYRSSERFLCLHTQERLLKRSNGIILIYDITNLKSFELIKEYNERINENGPSNLKKVLVGTKCDLEDERKVTTEEGKKLAKELGINNFFEVSAKTGKNVEEAYYSLFREILMDYKKPIILDDKEKEDEKKNKCAK